ncbi:MAG: 2-oxoacid:acceptor oxidoreductase family protein [Tissierellia bacterium]|nr:2-oxoacid:acceptor oxidoreductase family protein [Tissierellia bacterium]
MTTHKIIVSGFGGQGVMGIGQLLTYAGLFDGYHVSWLPSYGPEMRGGSANCSVIISEEPIGAPNISTATSAILLNGPSLDKFEDSVAPEGALFLNTSLVTNDPKRSDLAVYKMAANELALEFGNPKTMNMIIVGAFNQLLNVVSEESLKKAVEKLYGKKGEKMLQLNYEALEFGMNKGKEMMGEVTNA